MGCTDSEGDLTISQSSWKFIKCLLAEFIGTFILLFMGLASCLKWNYNTDHDQITRISFAFGLTISAIAYTLGPVSGAHVNPAITIAFMVCRRIKYMKGLCYIFCQCCGAIAGSGVLYALQSETFEGHNTHSFGLTLPNPKLVLAQALFTEAILTMILTLVVLTVTDKHWEDFKGSAALAIGLGVVALELGFINATGGSLNPARTLGPAVIMLEFHDMWIYWVGPIGGAVFGAFVYETIIYDMPESMKDKKVDNSSDTDNNNSPNGDGGDQLNGVQVGNDNDQSSAGALNASGSDASGNGARPKPFPVSTGSAIYAPNELENTSSLDEIPRDDGVLRK